MIVQNTGNKSTVRLPSALVHTRSVRVTGISRIPMGLPTFGLFSQTESIIAWRVESRRTIQREFVQRFHENSHKKKHPFYV